MYKTILRENENSDTLVVFIHGFMGNPEQFEDLAKFVYDKGFSYISVLLSGHSGSLKEFIKSTYVDWENSVQNEIDKLKDKYNKIYLIGHSMGGLLALNASMNADNKVCGIMLISTPLEVKFLKMNPIKVLKVFKPGFNFYKLLNKTKKILNQISVPVIGMHSEKDEIVNITSSKLFQDGLINTDKEFVILKESGHINYTEKERKIIAEKLLSFIK